MNKKNEMLIAIGLMLVILILIGFLLYNISTEGGKCYLNPTGYAINQIEEQAGSKVLCTCSFNEINMRNIYLDNTGIVPQNQSMNLPLHLQNR
jgi:hypothetical protein